jgi:hypothetical protein
MACLPPTSRPRFFQDVRWVTLKGGVLEGEEPASLTLELQARNAQDARVLAQHKLGELRRRAGIPVRQAPVVWVARLADGHASSLRFLEQAKELLEAESFELAVAAAQIHLELQVRVLVEMIAERTGSLLLAAVIGKQARWAPHERWLRPVLEALLGVKMTDCEAWTPYEAHVARRNGVVHAGQEIDADSAKASLDTVSALWLWLNDAATAATDAS